ncbi:MAG TPA: hypothetical protein VIT91_02290 [Chthoniobacterales bacterium]
MLAKSQSDIVVSLVVPVETSKGNITSLMRDTLLTLGQIFTNVEIVAVPVPQSGETFEELKYALSSVPNSRVLRLANTSDHDDAVLAGVYSCIGDYVVVLDPLIGNATSTIELLVQRCRQGAGIVFAKSTATAIPLHGHSRPALQWLGEFLFGSAANLALQTLSASVFCISRDICNLVLSVHPRGWQLRTLLAGFGQPERLVEYIAEQKPRIGLPLRIRRLIGVLRSSQKSGGRINLGVSLIIFAAFLWNIILTVGLITLDSQVANSGSSLNALVRINLFVCIAALLAQLLAIAHLVMLSKKRTERTWFIIEEASGTAPSYGESKNVIEGDLSESKVGVASIPSGSDDGTRRV